MKTAGNNIKLGALVITIIVALMAGLYLIGDKKNLFDDTFVVKTHFKDVNGLAPGNNVRFAGIDVGTVEDVEIISDTSVLVTMIIEKKYQSFIRTNAIAMLGSDGMMGNKLVSITSSGKPGTQIKDGEVIVALNAISMDETTRTLSATNQNLKEITDDLKNMTNKLDSSALWMVIQDTSIALSLKATTYALSENMAAMQESFLLKGYFNRKEKDKEKAKEEKQEEKDRKKRERKDKD
ncbi:MAG TPA: MlaD family protein [Bacteroidia bacterium]|nr:MlaD family protein [Bacteroidia bacterium]